MTDPKQTLKELVDHSERLGVIGSPSSTTELTLDILATAVTKKLVGELALFAYEQEGLEHYALGQITEISLRNVWHEDSTMRSIIRQRGPVKAVSERQDTHQGEMVISAVFANQNGKYIPSILGTVPPTGTFVYLVDNQVLDILLKPYMDEIFYLGHVYGSKPKLPLWFRHFGRGGAGEAYHLGIFGKTGSGKSVLAKTILLAYSSHKQMGLFVFDPQGEFSKDLRKSSGNISSMEDIFSPTMLNSIKRDFEIYDLSRFRLGTWDIFGELLKEFHFFEELDFKKGDYQETAADYVVDFLRNHNKHELGKLNDEAFNDTLNYLSDNVHRIYSDKLKIAKVKGFILEAQEKAQNNIVSNAKKRWEQTISFFSNQNGKVTIDDIIKRALNVSSKRPLITVDLSTGKPNGISNSDWDDKIKPLLIDDFLSRLIRQSETAYKEGESLNTLVVMDEASRLAPQGRIENERKQRIKTRLVDAVRTTRKYGLGWMFISQTLSSLDNEIIQQLRISFFGFGLSMGSEYQKLKELVGGQGTYLKLYQQFRDPHSTFGTTGEYSFMTIGPVSPLSFAGTPLFLNAFNDPKDFIEANKLTVISKPKLL